MHFGRCLSTFDGANQYAYRRVLRVTMNRQNCEAAKAAIERPQHLDEAVSAPDQSEDTAGFQNSPACVNPALKRRGRRYVSDLARLVRRGAVPRGIVERRIHQDDIDAVRGEAGGGKSTGRGCESQFCVWIDISLGPNPPFDDFEDDASAT